MFQNGKVVGRDFKIDETPLTPKQMEAAKSLIQFGQAWADQVVQVMKNSGLWGKGFVFNCTVSPEADVLTEEVKFYRKVVDGEGFYDEWITRHKGAVPMFKDWKTLAPCTSREFIHLFDEPQNAAGAKERQNKEHPLPADGLWIGDDPTADPVDHLE